MTKTIETAIAEGSASYPQSDALLTANNIVAGYRPDLPILHGVSIKISAGEIVTILGPNGAGKSTLIKAIAGLITVISGELRLENKNILALPAHKLARAGVAYVPQTSNVFTTLTIQENLIMGGMTQRKSAARKRIDEIYTLYPVLAQHKGDKAAVLSGGQRQILAVARALLTRPMLIMLDEPTAGLSPIAAAELFSVVRDLAADGVAVLMVEQNAKAALRASDRAYVLVEGHNRLHGPAAELLKDTQIGEIFLGARPSPHSQQSKH